MTGLNISIDNILKTTMSQEVVNEEQVLFYRAKEVCGKTITHPINLIESIIGFKFMGNEFIDQSIAINFEHAQTTPKKNF